MTSVSGILSSVLLIAVLIICDVCTFQIKELKVPGSIKNGTAGPIVLDCVIVVDDDEHTIALDWYLEDSPVPIYKWVPGVSRNYSKLLDGHVNSDYVVGEGLYVKYRALSLKNITTKFNGKYTCQYTSDKGHLKAHKKMVVYVPVKRMTLDSKEIENHSIYATCEAEGIFPEPELSLIRKSENGSKTKLSSKAMISKISENEYSAKLEYTVNRTALPKDGKTSTYECIVSIPNTTYKKVQSIQIKNLDSSFLSEDKSGQIWGKTAASTKDIGAASFWTLSLKLLSVAMVINKASSHLFS